MPDLRGVALLAVATTLLACGESGSEPGPPEPEPPGPGAIHLTVLTSGYTLDPSGYTAMVNGVEVRRLALRDSVVLSDLSPGSYTVELTDVATNCAAQPSASQTLTLPSRGSALLNFRVQCDSALRGVILFTRYPGTGPEGITAMAVRPDGTGLQTLFPGAGPSASPDGRFLVVTRFTPSYSIYRIKADGTGLLDLTPATAGDQMPAWSPDGAFIAFTSDRSGEWQLYTMRPDGTGQQRLTHSDLQETSPRWSPDGSRILIARTPESGPVRVVMVRADGSGEDVVPGPAGGSVIPLDWSPDGNRILLNSNADLFNHVWVMNADGTSLTNLTPGSELPYGSARWAPEGEEIVLDRGNEPGTEILRIDLLGSDTTLVTLTPAPQFAKVDAWLP